jgi:hypothetical protein
MPHLRRDTYASFLDRNANGAVHSRTQFHTLAARLVYVAGEGSRSVQPAGYTRAGLSRDGLQALIYRKPNDWSREGYLLWEKRQDRWTLVESNEVHRNQMSFIEIRTGS